MRNLFYSVSLFVIFSSYLLMLYVAYLMFWPTTSFKVLITPTPVEQKQYKQGDLVIMHPKSCKYNDRPGIVKRVIRNIDVPSIAFGIPDVPMVAIAGECREYTVVVPLPSTIPPGRYVVENTFRIEVNNLHTEEYHTRSDIFIVNK